MAAGSAFTLVPDIVEILEPEYPNIIIPSESMKPEYLNLSDTPAEKFRLKFKALSDTNWGTLQTHVNDQSGGDHSFSWQSVPSYIGGGLDIKGRWVKGSLHMIPAVGKYWGCELDFEKHVYAGYTKLLLHCNGAHGSQVFIDSSPSEHTITAENDAQVDTSEKKMGTGAGLFNGTLDFIYAPYSTDFLMGGNPFTIDFWIRFNSLTPATYDGIFEIYQASDWYARFYVQKIAGPDRQLVFEYSGGGGYAGVGTGATGIIANQWYHVAIIRGWGGVVNNFAITIDGSLSGSVVSFSTTWPALTSGSFVIGYTDIGGANRYFDGWIDEFRVLKGKAAWTENFTPEDSEY